MVSIVWAPFSNFMQTPTGRTESEKRFPRFTFQYTQSLPNVLDNDFNFGKIDFKTEYEKQYLNGQKTSLLLQEVMPWAMFRLRIYTIQCLTTLPKKRLFSVLLLPEETVLRPCFLMSFSLMNMFSFR